MKVFVLVLILCIVSSWAIPDSEKPILPTANFSTNFCNFPRAWGLTRGKNVNVGIAYDKTEKSYDWVKAVARLAPEANVKKIEISGFLDLSTEITKYNVFLILKELQENQFQQTLKAVKFYTGKNAAIILPAYFGPMKADYDYRQWRRFIKEASTAGAIIVGAHSTFYQLGNLTYWKTLPVDVFALHSGIQGDKYFKPGALLDRNIDDVAYKVAAAVALLKSKEPGLSPAKIKQRFHDKGRKVIWAHVQGKGNQGRVWAYMSKESLEKDVKGNDNYKPKVVDLMEGRCFDAGLLLGLPPMKSGEWSYKTLNVSAAQQLATGKGVTVAILDHMFVKEDPALKGRTVKPGSVVEGEPVFTAKPGHGIWMARDLIRVAPDVKIMPVRTCCRDEYTGLYIKGIEYAVENGADIISLSHRAVPKNKQEELDMAIEKASQKGVTFVYIHYYSDRDDVVRPGPIEFARGDKGEYVYVVGTNFIDESSFPFTWGLSGTAPIVSGVIAMMKEINPELTPREIKKILLKSNNKTPDGYPLLDAFKAVKNTKNHKPALSENEFKEIFDRYGVKGTFLLYHLENDALTVYNEERADKTYLPASTFKILNSLIALETEVIKDQCEVIEWDRKRRRFDQWNQDQTLQTAFRYSVVWAYQELARRIGKKQMKHWVDKTQYGNRDIAGEIDTFWLDGELRISPREQLEFVKKLYKNELPFSQRNMDIVKEIMIVEQTPKYILRGKTGWLGIGLPQIGWFVGYLEKAEDVYFFVINIDIVKSRDANARIGITKDIFKKLKL